ncbi:hypothetical protein ALQ37_200088 [Pseudomonas syringae pv. aptata]|uniref:Uncharacterized protein n=1 Tax=Pseudomonas syringae pv. aptata TaxID=83167 RepID=A0A0N8T7W8_PSEAP|nr:hypothetical protein [Pseudomonas syringae]KPY97952.1 Uncharacterized protein ALO85_04158 [Pseudomonas syringae pv. aptata]RMO65467.1 hypothetical protein ALQ37_200088 [Pseudomonas syringae pv. aptata]
MSKSNGDDSFRAFLTACTENQDEVVAQNSPYVAMMDALDSFLLTHITNPTKTPSDLVMHALRINARFMLMTGFRIGLTGHAAGVYPTLRTALENACYAFLMSQDEALSDVWMKRSLSVANTKAFKKTFNKAIAEARDLMDELHPNNLGTWMYELYQASMEFGAHPNALTILLHTRFSDDEATGWTKYENIALYTVGNFEFDRTLLACVEMGLAVAIVLSMTFEKPSQEIIEAVNKLNKMKNELEDMIRSKFGIAAVSI